MIVRAAVFDFDFTLADPSAWVTRAWSDALQVIGEPTPNETILQSVIGKPLRAQYARIVGEAPEGNRFENFRAAFNRYRDTHAPAQTRIESSAESTIAVLRAAGIALGIVSTGGEERIKAILRRATLFQHFSSIRAGSRNKAEDLTETIRFLGVVAASAIDIGDHPDDCKSAAAAHVRFFAIRTNVHRPTEFPAGTPILKSLSELVSLLF